MEIEDLPKRGRGRKSLDELTGVELGAVCGAVMPLLQDRFTRAMDDPDLDRLVPFRKIRNAAEAGGHGGWRDSSDARVPRMSLPVRR